MAKIMTFDHRPEVDELEVILAKHKVCVVLHVCIVLTDLMSIELGVGG